MSEKHLRHCARRDCLQMFVSNGHGQKYCSYRCRGIAQSRRWRKKNRLAYNQKMGRYRHRHPKQIKSYRLKSLYGITSEQKEARIAQQGGCCAACGTSSPTGHGWQTDHNHKTGELRDELCPRCNVVLGYVEDDPEVLQKLLVYLQKWSH